MGNTTAGSYATLDAKRELRPEEEPNPGGSPFSHEVDDLGKCFLLDDGYILYDSDGNAISRLPVSAEAYASGVFMQNTDDDFCERNKNWPCQPVGSFVNCTVCVYDRSKFVQSSYKDEIDQKIIPNCRPEVS